MPDTHTPRRIRPCALALAAGLLASTALAAATARVGGNPAAASGGEPTTTQLDRTPGIEWISQSPLRVEIEGANERLVRGALPLAVDADALADLRIAEGRTLVLGLPLPDAMPIDLALTRVSPFAEGARVILMTAEGERDLPLPDVAIFKGNVAGAPESRVFISMHDGVSNGYVRVDDRTYIIAPDPDQPGQAAIYNEEILANVEGNDADADGENQAPPTSCLTEPGHFTWALPEVEDQSFSLRNDPPCRELTIAIDTDTEFSQRFGFNDNNASAYAATLMSAVSEIYEEDLNISLVVSTIRLWDQGVNDPYPTNNGSTSLNTLRNQSLGARDLAHLLSGKFFSDTGGVAYINGLCNGNSAGVSGALNLSFPFPLQDNRSNNWDPIVVAHEIGHNVGSGHTHEAYFPLIDGCGNGDCSASFGGTIMSYCHLCPGGVANIALTFHPTVRSRILSYVASRGCDYSRPVSALASNPVGQTITLGEPVTFSVTLDSPLGDETFQWFRNGFPVAGGTSASLTIANVSFDDIGAYTCRVDLACGFDISEDAMLDVVGDDCDGNGFDDTLDISRQLVDDCNGNGIPDSCDVASTYGDFSPVLIGIGGDSPQAHTFTDLPEPAGNVQIHFDAKGDFSSGTEVLNISLNGTPYPARFATGGEDCPQTPDRDTLTIGAAEFTSLIAGGTLAIDMTAPLSVSTNLCFPVDSSVQVIIEYPVNSTLDTDGNGTPDSCEVASPCIADVTTTGTSNGTPDGAVDLSDFSYFLTLWSSSASIADVTTTGTSNGIADGSVDLSDFSYYLTLWSAGCP